ncbi:MAG: YdcF family protein [Pseudomonadota bacterium]
MIDVGSLKPWLTVLVLPPVPWMVLVLVGARLILPKRGLGYLVLLSGLALMWLSACEGTAVWMQNHWLTPPAPLLRGEQVRLSLQGQVHLQQGAQARRMGRALPTPTTGILVLGGGLVPLAPEYGVTDLSHFSAERLRYGVWLSRQTGWPLGFSGGVGWGQKKIQEGPGEAEVAGRVAQQMYGQPLRWIESDSSDTRENAARSVALLAGQGVTEIVLVTDAWHMKRARRAFEQAAMHWAARERKPVPVITPGAMGYWSLDAGSALDWMPSSSGLTNVRAACRELLGLLMGS